MAVKNQDYEFLNKLQLSISNDSGNMIIFITQIMTSMYRFSVSNYTSVERFKHINDYMATISKMYIELMNKYEQYLKNNSLKTIEHNIMIKWNNSLIREIAMLNESVMNLNDMLFIYLNNFNDSNQTISCVNVMNL